MTEPFHDLGREANNDLASEFEDQLAAVCVALGWPVVCRNIDAFVMHQGQSQSRGFDVLAVIADPQLPRRYGCVLEAKRHEKPVYADAAGEAQTLHDKVARLNASEAFWSNTAIRKQLDSPLQHGIVCHRTLGFDPDKAQERREDSRLRNRKHGAPVPVVQFLGPDLLEALAHLERDYRPRRWLWPPMRRRDRAWSSACSPWTLIGGMAAFQGADGAERVWLHDALVHGDAELLAQVFADWGINPVQLICTRLRAETWRLIREDWAQVAEQTAQRDHGRLPASVRPLLLSDKLTTFDATWASAA
jgi:hypothetical protein